MNTENQKMIVFTAPNTAELLERNIPVPKGDNVLVKLAVSSISSGTERANLTGEVNISVMSIETTVHFPRYAGYSSSGTVVSVGENVAGIKPGDRVALSWSSHSQYVCINQNDVYVLPDGISFEDAALFHIGTFPLAAIRKCRLEIGESAVVMGMGILGAVAIKLLRAAGAAPIIAVDPVAEKRKKALEIGADYALNPFDDDFTETAKSLLGGGANVAIEVTGSGKALDGVLDIMAPMGRVALLGCTRNSDFTIDYYHKVHGPGISLIGAHTLARPKAESSKGLWTQRDDVFAQIRLTELNRLNLSSLVDETHSPSEAPQVYSRLAKDKHFPIVQFDWRLLQ